MNHITRNDFTKPDGPTLNIAVTVRQITPGTWTSPILYASSVRPNFGGATSGLYDSRNDFVGHDVIWIDHRGVGRSDGRTVCAGVAAATPLSFELEKPLIKQCLETANDFAAVRRSLGVTNWSVFTTGTSFEYAIRLSKLDPGTIASIVAFNPNVAGLGLSIASLTHAFEEYTKGCAESTECAANGRFDEIFARAKEAAKTTSVTKIIDPSTNQLVALDMQSFIQGVALGISDPSLAPILPALLSKPANAAWNDSVAKLFVQRAILLDAFDVALNCQPLDYIYPSQKSWATATGPYAGYSRNYICDGLTGIPEASSIIGFDTDIPILTITSRYTGATNQQAVAEMLKNATRTTQVDVPGLNDIRVQLHDCWQATSQAFFANPSGTTDTSCLTAGTVKIFK